MSKWHDEVGKKRWCLIKFFIIFISKGEDENMYCPDDKKVIEFKFKKKTKTNKKPKNVSSSLYDEKCSIHSNFKHLGKEFVSVWKKKLKVVPHHANSSLFLSLTLQLIITLDAANVHFVRVVDHVEWGLGRSNYGSRNGRNMSVLDMEGLNCFSAAPSDQHKSRTQSTLG